MMTREELSKTAKPILFNTEMVRAILDGRKTVTRRVIKPQPPTYARVIKRASDMYMWQCDLLDKDIKPPYQPGDILYVRETWKIVDYLDNLSLKFEYEADGKISDFIDFTRDRLQKFLKYINKKGWCPALFMPKEVARIFLRVTDVRVERLRDITVEQAQKEGVSYEDAAEAGYERWKPTFYDPDSGGEPYYVGAFEHLWDSTIKKSDLDRYGWDANPWVWVIEFERVMADE